MKIRDVLTEREQGVSFEFFPPRTQKAKQALARTIEVLRHYDPLYVSMTYGAAGAEQEQTKEAVKMLTDYENLVVMPHLTCVGAKVAELEKLLDYYQTKGITNIMALRGDPPKDSSPRFSFESQELKFARDLVALLKKNYPDFCVGVAVYPEGHIETASLEEDTKYTKEKIDTGADFAVTQMFFDNVHYFSLLDRMEEFDLSIPVLPGILPLTDIRKVRQFASICRATIPRRIEEKMEALKNNPADMEKAGIDFTIEQCRDLKKNGVDRLHFFTLNKPEVITTILRSI